MHETTFIGIQRTELLIEAGLFRFLGEQLGHLTQLRVFAAPITKRVDEDPPLVPQLAPECDVGHMLQRLQRLTAMPDEQLRLVAFDVQTKAVRRVFHNDSRLDTQGGDETFEKSRDVLIGVGHSQLLLSAASVFPPPTRFNRRSAAGRTVRTAGGPIM